MSETFQDQVAQLRRTQILDAAITVFAQRGFHRTTIHAVAQAAGVADGTIYLYFANKSALLVGILDRMTAAAHASVDPAHLAGLDLHSFLKLYLQLPLAGFAADNFELFRVIISEIMVNPELRALYYTQVLEPTMRLGAEQFQAWAAQHGVAPSATPLLMHTLSSLVLGLIVQRIMGDETLAAQWDTLPKVLSTLLVSGIPRSTP